MVSDGKIRRSREFEPRNGEVLAENLSVSMPPNPGFLTSRIVIDVGFLQNGVRRW